MSEKYTKENLQEQLTKVQRALAMEAQKMAQLQGAESSIKALLNGQDIVVEQKPEVKQEVKPEAKEEPKK